MRELQSPTQPSSWPPRSPATTGYRLSTPAVWIEHHPPIATDGDTETFDLVTFSSYEVTERGPYLGETRLTLGEATWKRITRGMVKILVDAEW